MFKTLKSVLDGIGAFCFEITQPQLYVVDCGVRFTGTPMKVDVETFDGVNPLEDMDFNPEWDDEPLTQEELDAEKAHLDWVARMEDEDSDAYMGRY